MYYDLCYGVGYINTCTWCMPTKQIEYLGLKNQYLEGVIGDFMSNFINNPGSWWTTVALRGKKIPLSSHEAFDQWVIQEYQGKSWAGDDYDFLKGIDR